MTRLQSAMLLVIFLLLSVTFYALYEEGRFEAMTARETIEEKTSAEARPLIAIGYFSAYLGQDEEYNVYRFKMKYRWNNSTNATDKGEEEVEVAISRTYSVEFERIYEIYALGSPPITTAPYYADVLEAFDGMILEAKLAGDGICEANENLALAPQDCMAMPQALGGIGRFVRRIEETRTHHIYLFKLEYRWNDSAYVQVVERVVDVDKIKYQPSEILVRLAVPKTALPDHIPEYSKLYRITARGSPPDVKTPYYTDTLEAYDEFRTTHSYYENTPLKGFYKACWEYNCTSDIPPWEKITPPLRWLFLSKIGEKRFDSMGYDVYTRGYVAKRPIIARGNISVAIVFLYDDSPMPVDAISKLKGISNTTKDESFMYIPAWYKEQASKLFGKGDIINMGITFFDSQLKLPENLLYRDKPICDFSSYVREQLPEVKNHDILVQYYYASAENVSVCATQPVSYNSIYFPARPSSIYAYKQLNLATFGLAHELAHIFGASDKYVTEPEIRVKYNAGCWIESGDPAESGRDLMCDLVPEGEGEFSRLPDLNELIIIEATAKEIGWYDNDGDGILEIEDPCPLNKDNDCVS